MSFLRVNPININYSGVRGGGIGSIVNKKSPLRCGTFFVLCYEVMIVKDHLIIEKDRGNIYTYHLNIAYYSGKIVICQAKININYPEIKFDQVKINNCWLPSRFFGPTLNCKT
jgi:hypothetical protein